MRVVIADDHPLYRDGLARAIRSDPRLSLAAVAADGLTALALIEEFEPDVALLDLSMPGLDGISVCARVNSCRPPLRTRVILLSAYVDPTLAALAADVGAWGYLEKDVSRAEICQGALAVAAGETAFPART
jgi:two-component system, NarL family, nitrate/nitrite response regulator NarL